MSFTESRPLGGAYALDVLWRRLGIDAAIHVLLAKRRIDERLTERVLFALVANRALAPSSKLDATRWIGADVTIDGLEGADEDACCRAMDTLLEVEASVARQIYDQVADLPNLEVDLLFFDTTSTYFELDEPYAPVARDGRGRVLEAGQAAGEPATAPAGFRSYGRSKDHRDDLPQVVVGMAVTRTGIPVRVWCWPGNTADSALIRQVKHDLREWTLARVVWVADRGFASHENRRYLQRAGGHYILGEPLRSGSAAVAAAVVRPGRYRTVTDSLQVKEARLPDEVGSGDRFVVCFNPEAAQPRPPRARPHPRRGLRPPGLAAVGPMSAPAIRVVLVDDDPLVRTGLRLVLGGAPQLEIVGEAGDGAEGLDVIGRTRPDVVLMDIRMPRMDGLAATQRLLGRPDPPRSSSSPPSTPTSTSSGPWRAAQAGSSSRTPRRR